MSKKEIIFRKAKLIKDPITETETVDVPVTYEELIVERRPASRDTYSELDLKHPVISREEIKIPLKREEIEVKRSHTLKKKLS